MADTVNKVSPKDSKTAKAGSFEGCRPWIKTQQLCFITLIQLFTKVNFEVIYHLEPWILGYFDIEHSSILYELSVLVSVSVAVNAIGLQKKNTNANLTEALEVTWGDHQSQEAPLGTMNVCIKATNS